MTDARHDPVQDSLRNGTPVTIRAIRPDDGERIREAFGKLDPETVYTRLFSYRSALSDAEVERITGADFDRQVALVVTIVQGDDEVIIAGGRYIAHGNPPVAAEVAFTVEEDYQGQGIASRLLQHLAAIARDKGIERFEAEVLPINKPMLGVFARGGLPMTQRSEDGVVHVTLSLERGGPGPC